MLETRKIRLTIGASGAFCDCWMVVRPDRSPGPMARGMRLGTLDWSSQQEPQLENKGSLTRRMGRDRPGSATRLWERESEDGERGLGEQYLRASMTAN